MTRWGGGLHPHWPLMEELPPLGLRVLQFYMMDEVEIWLEKLVHQNNVLVFIVIVWLVTTL